MIYHAAYHLFHRKTKLYWYVDFLQAACPCKDPDGNKNSFNVISSGDVSPFKIPVTITAIGIWKLSNEACGLVMIHWSTRLMHKDNTNVWHLHSVITVRKGLAHVAANEKCSWLWNFKWILHNIEINLEYGACHVYILLGFASEIPFFHSIGTFNALTKPFLSFNNA